jgi:quinolinate synthase
VHARFSEEGLLALKAQYPNAKVLAHPECKATILQHADVIGSTQALLDYAKNANRQSPITNNQFIVVTESGILHEMQKACPEVEFIAVPAVMDDLTICQCNECEYMRMCTLQNLHDCLLNESNEIVVDEAIAKDAIRPIQRMLEMS